jgi:cytosine permease
VIASVTAYVSGQANIGIAPVNGIIVAVILYAILVKVIPQPVQSGESEA